MDFGIMGLDNLVSSSSQSSNNGSFSADKQKWHGSGINDDVRDSKMAKISLQRSNFSEGHQQMLSFSSPNSQNVTLPYYYQTSNAFAMNTGYGNGLSFRGPFTPFQWMELEHQALIFKYITANVTVPSYLLNPIKKALESSGFSSCFSGLRSNPCKLGWGGFHLGLSNTDPEPGRCRRTDGKKWRCSKDAVPDQKYCERHINRGRHRSRKPVEAQSGIVNAKSASSISATSATGVSNGLSTLQPGGTNSHPSGIPNINRSLLDKENTNEAYQQTTTTLSIASPKVSSLNDHHDPYKEPSRSEFGLVCSDSLLNPLNTSLVSFTNYDHSHNLNSHDQIKSQHALREFMGELEMGLGVGTIIDSEQKQRQETNWVPISWEPSIGGPLGEVLHNTSNNTSECNNNNNNNAKALNLMERLDNNSPRLASSPTGVLQRGACGSLSNSSAGSSPRGEISKTYDGASFSNGLGFGSLSKF